MTLAPCATDQNGLSFVSEFGLSASAPLSAGMIHVSFFIILPMRRLRDLAQEILMRKNATHNKPGSLCNPGDQAVAF
jgi:hypothetical protein